MTFNFASWLAGFIDGEGCFQIRCHHLNSKHYPYFNIRLRDDDLDILLKIQEFLNGGTIYRSHYNADCPGRKPAAELRLYKEADCLRLVEILDQYPLQAKKARDYAIWREAVLEKQKPMTERNQEKLKYLHDKIRLIRQYGSPNELEEPEPFAVQLTLMDS